MVGVQEVIHIKKIIQKLKRKFLPHFYNNNLCKFNKRIHSIICIECKEFEKQQVVRGAPYIL